jgi:hypothetical protein
MTVDHQKQRWVLAIVCCVIVAAPFLVVRFPPVTDLPQHVAQVRLFLEALGDPSSPYTVQWLTPYSLVYLVIGACWAVVGPEHAGRVAMLLIGVGWTAAAHLLAARRGRAPETAVLASVFFFNPSLNWGFFSFAVGWPAFLYWTVLVARDRERGLGARDAALVIATSLALYFSHALWLAAGLAWLAVSTLVFRPSLRIAAARFACAAPAAILAALWYATSPLRLATETIWTPPIWARLSPFVLVEALLGGIRGPLEYVVLAAAAVWIGVGLWQARRTLRTSVDAPLLACGLMLFVAALVLPLKYESTVQFWVRWTAPAVILLVLALPPPAIAPRLLRAWALGVLGALCIVTTLAWTTFERTELSGLPAALEALPPSPNVLGLDFTKGSPTVKGRPFMQAFAYAQVLRGGRVSLSFAEFPQTFVAFEQPPPHPWTLGLEWYAERVRDSDIRHFDHVLVDGPDSVHEAFSLRRGLTPVTTEGHFRLYRVERAP